jgi:hypothetical protein
MGEQRQVGHCPYCIDDSDGHMACWCNNDCCDDRWERQVNTRQVNLHTDDYVEQLINWGFTLDFIALDAGIDLDSLKMRFRRKAKRENWNGHKKAKFGIGCNLDDCGCCQEA